MDVCRWQCTHTDNALETIERFPPYAHAKIADSRQPLAAALHRMLNRCTHKNVHTRQFEYGFCFGYANANRIRECPYSNESLGNVTGAPDSYSRVKFARGRSSGGCVDSAARNLPISCLTRLFQLNGSIISLIVVIIVPKCRRTRVCAGPPERT